MMKRTAFLLAATLAPMTAMADALDLEIMPQPHLSKPAGEIKSSVVLISDAAGWGANEDAMAAKLADNGAIVIGIDFPAYLKAFSTYADDCIYTISDVEYATQQIERDFGVATYQKPIIAGIGEGGALAIAMASQTPPATVRATIAVDPLEGIPNTEKEFCTPANKQVKGDRKVYSMTEGALPDPMTTLFTAKADAAGRASVEALKKTWPDIEIKDSSKDAATTLTDALITLSNTPLSDDGTLGLPLTVLQAKPSLDTMAVIFSGDGGWRDIDAEIGEEMQKSGIPVVGVDSLRYFWSKQSQEQVARDLSRIISHYRGQFGVKKVMLIGYSFGADILPDAYQRLPQSQKETVALISLLAMSGEADYEISVMSIMGANDLTDGIPNHDVIAKIDPKKLQCLYGSEEEGDACPKLAPLGIETISLNGGHHFDEDYPALAKRLIASLKEHLGKAGP